MSKKNDNRRAFENSDTMKLYSQTFGAKSMATNPYQKMIIKYDGKFSV